MLTIESAINPIYADVEGTCIQLHVKFKEFNEVLPFGATLYDPMPYGVELYHRALAGEFGPIAPMPVITIGENQPITKGAQTL
jgi:hypothetical protein